jgi:ABC-type transport system substrate-binding protein
MTSYWTKAFDRRLSRRRTLATAGAATAAAALLAACGGGKTNTKQEAASLLKSPTDSTKEAKRGGVYKSNNDRAFSTLDPHASGTTGAGRDMGYQRPLSLKAGYLKPATQGIFEGDAAQSWEYSGDKLQLTLKLRPENHFDPRPPTNGRVVQAEDVVFSHNRILASGGRRLEWFNSLNPDNALLSWSAPDKSTVLIKLAFPDPGFEAMLAQTSSSYLHIVPTEAEDKFDLRNEQRGSGPYMLAEYVPSARMTWKRNPGYWNKDVPIVDQAEWPIITEYAAGLAQFTAGHTYDYAVAQEDILQTKKDAPAVDMYANQLISTPGFRWFWGFKDSPKNQFRDERMRQAFALSQDRELWVDSFYNVSAFRSAGLPVQVALATAMEPNQTGWWLDPSDKEFGENAKYYKKDLAEAKKLVAAAGFPNGIDVDSYWITSGNYGRELNKWTESIFGMVLEAGIRVAIHSVNFAAEWRPNYTLARGNFEGISNIQDSGPPDLGAYLYSHYHPNGALFMGFSDDGRSTFAGDPYLTDLCAKLRTEFDTQKRIAMAKDLQRYDAKKQYYPRYPGGSNTFLLAWPALRNYQAYQGTTAEIYYWIDPTKAPLA